MGSDVGNRGGAPRPLSGRSLGRSSRRGSQARPAHESASSSQSRLQSSSKPPIRIAILTDNRLFDEGLRRIIASDPALRLAKVDGSKGTPISLGSDSTDIVLADARMESSLAVCAELRRAGTHPWVIFLGAGDDDEWTLKALKAGARGIMGREAGGELLRAAVRVVHVGQIWARRETLARIVDELASPSRTPPATEQWPPGRLSTREEEIVRAVAQGLSNEEIADRLSISEATVKAHLTSIFQKLRVRTRGRLSALYHRTLAHSPIASALA